VGEIPKKLGNLDCEAIPDFCYNRRAEDGRTLTTLPFRSRKKRLRSREGQSNLLQPRVIDLMSPPLRTISRPSIRGGLTVTRWVLEYLSAICMPKNPVPPSTVKRCVTSSQLLGRGGLQSTSESSSDVLELAMRVHLRSWDAFARRCDRIAYLSGGCPGLFFLGCFSH
jgi:hypothetical protein